MAARKLAEEFGGDRSAADWRHFGRLGSDQVGAVLRIRDLSHKGDEKRQDQYVDRTITKAFKIIDSRSLR